MKIDLSKAAWTAYGWFDGGLKCAVVEGFVGLINDEHCDDEHNALCEFVYQTC